jgi:hypothetical protein
MSTEKKSFHETGSVLFEDGSIQEFDVTITASDYDPWIHYGRVKTEIEKVFGKPVEKYLRIEGATIIPKEEIVGFL